MVVRGIDVSEWQAGMNVERVVRENDLGFVFARTNYGANHDDVWFHRHCDGAERGGALVLPYVYPLATDVRGSIADAHRIIGGRYGSVIVDWEHGSGGGAELRQAHELLWELGYETPIVYDPRWYWESVGRPNLDWMRGRVRGRWKSWYPDNDPGPFDAIWRKVPGTVWNDDRGGVPTLIVQFTSVGRLSGYPGNLDLNYFAGSRDELTALLGGDTMSHEIVYNAVAAVLKDIGAGNAEDLAESLRAALVHYPIPVGEGATSIHTEVQRLGGRLDQLQTQVATLAASGVPVDVKLSDADVTRLVNALAQAQDARARDNDPETGPVS